MPCLNLTLPRLTVFLLSTFAAFSAEAHGNHTHWGYTGHDSPESWGSLSEEFRLCSTGKNQSPVNITETVSAETVSVMLTGDWFLPVEHKRNSSDRLPQLSGESCPV